jgi:Zn-dependent peptidase ImmA (M78 family)/transcriptional regulator with XRE-family HTH domain
MSEHDVDLSDPVLLARVKQAREDAGLTQAAVADRLGMTRTTLVAIEHGQRRLRAEELIAMADLYGRRIHELLRPTPPRSLVAQFRAALGPFPEEAELVAAASTLQQLSEDYVQLEQIVDAPLPRNHPRPHAIAAGDVERQASWLADGERERLRLGDGPLPHLREILEQDVGMRVFALALPSRIGGLFAYDEELGACLGMNARQRYERQRYSLAHEYAHFLTRRDRPEVTVVLRSYQRVPAAERFADAFARHLLMPTVGVERRFHALRDQAGGKVTGALFLQMADYFGVSVQAMVLRLQDLRLVRAGTWAKLDAAQFKPDEGRALLGLASRPADDVLLPRRYTLLAFNAFKDERISEERFARLLRMDRVSARLLAEELAGTFASDDTLDSHAHW